MKINEPYISDMEVIIKYVREHAKFGKGVPSYWSGIIEHWYVTWKGDVFDGDDHNEVALKIAESEGIKVDKA